MKILVGWNDAEEIDLLNLYLIGGGENEVLVTRESDRFLKEAEEQSWDVVLMTVSFPTTGDEGFEMLSKMREILPGIPTVLAVRPDETISLPKFLKRGLRFYLYRDENKDYIFLIQSTLESAIAAARAEEAERLAEHLRREIEGVRMLQEAIIPHGLDVPAGYSAVARYEPSEVTVMGDRPVVMAGGDYYDLFCASETTLTALIGDASGHGLKACMSIMTMHTLVRMLSSEQFRDTSSFVSAINQRLCDSSIVQSGGGFITLLYSTLDIETHRVSWTSAGHPLPLLQNLTTNEVWQVGKNSDGGPPLGIMPGVEYPAYELEMPENSRLLIYSDGLADALPAGKADIPAFGMEGIVRAMQESQKMNVDDALDHLFHSSNQFTEGEGRHDDTSVLLLERRS